VKRWLLSTLRTSISWRVIWCWCSLHCFKFHISFIHNSVDFVLILFPYVLLFYSISIWIYFLLWLFLFDITLVQIQETNYLHLHEAKYLKRLDQTDLLATKWSRLRKLEVHLEILVVFSCYVKERKAVVYEWFRWLLFIKWYLYDCKLKE